METAVTWKNLLRMVLPLRCLQNLSVKYVGDKTNLDLGEWLPFMATGGSPLKESDVTQIAIRSLMIGARVSWVNCETFVNKCSSLEHLVSCH